MSLAERAEVEQLLSPFHDALYSFVAEAWSEWMETQSVIQPVSARSRANVVWDFIVRRAQEAFENDPRVAVIPQAQTCYFLVGDRVVLRFKKGDQQGLSRNYPTQQALNYHEPEQDLFGPGLSRVEVVYVLNATETALSSVQVVARERERIEWTYELQPAGSATVVEVPAPRAGSRGPIVRLRDSGSAGENESGASE